MLYFPTLYFLDGGDNTDASNMEADLPEEPCPDRKENYKKWLSFQKAKWKEQRQRLKRRRLQANQQDTSAPELPRLSRTVVQHMSTSFNKSDSMQVICRRNILAARFL